MESTSCDSKDGGKTWSKGEKALATGKPPGVSGGGSAAVSPFGKIVQLSDGTALMAVYYKATLANGKQQFQSWLFRSKDSGQTWGDPTLIQLDGNETALAVLKDKSIVAAVRTSSRSGTTGSLLSTIRSMTRPTHRRRRKLKCSPGQFRSHNNNASMR
jgi:Neuraminidase (sialidase)